MVEPGRGHDENVTFLEVSCDMSCAVKSFFNECPPTAGSQAEPGKKRQNYSQLRVRSFEKSPKCDSGCFFALFLVLVVIFLSDLKIFENFLFSVF